MNTNNYQAGIDFQRQVFELVSAKLRQNKELKSMVVLNYDKGPIDIVAEVTRTEKNALDINPHEIAEMIYIECKKRNKKIDLDIAGKIFCYTISDQPHELIIVSNGPLAPETINFAHIAFSSTTVKNAKRSSKNPIVRTKFSHYTLEQLQEIHTSAPEDIAPNKDPDEFKDESTLQIAWELIEVNSFGEEILLCDDSTSKTHYIIKSGISFIIRIINLKKYRAIDGETGPSMCFLNKSMEEIPEIRPCQIAMEENSFSVDFLVQDFEKIQEAAFVFIAFDSNCVYKKEVVFPKLIPIEYQPLLQELRPGLASRLAKKLSSSTQVLLIDGDGGIGKTYLAERVCENLTSHGYRIRSHIWHEYDDESVFYHLILPWYIEKASISEHTFYDIVASCLGVLSGERGLNQEQLKDRNLLPTAATICANKLSEIDEPILWKLQACHEMSPVLIAALRVFIQRCLDICPNVRFILEYRSNEGCAEWSDFIRFSQYLKAHHHHLEPVHSKELCAAIEKTVVGVDVKELSSVLIKKTQGNPLYIENVLQYWVSIDYLNLIKNLSAHKLHINSLAGIHAEIDRLPIEKMDFLIYRLKKTVENHANSFALADMIYFASLMPHPQKIYILGCAAGLSEKDALDIIGECCLEGIFQNSFNANADDDNEVVFTHDLLRLAARSTLGQYTSPNLKERASLLLNKDVTLDCIQAGRMCLGLADYQEAYKWFSMASKTSSDDYTSARMALFGMREALNSIALITNKDKENRIEVILNLGWAENQSGRIVDARQTYFDGLSEVESLFSQGDSEQSKIASHFRTRIRHRLVTVEIEMAFLKSALENFQRALYEVENLSILYHLSNRLLLAAEALGCHEEGWDIANISLKIIDMIIGGSGDSNIEAVIRSDIGRLYFFSSPSDALDLWKQGVRLSGDKRQLFHARADVFAAELACGKAISEKDIISLRDELSGKIPSQVPRLELLIAISQFVDGNLGKAQHTFKNAASLASMNGQLALRTAALINAMLLNQVISGNALGTTALRDEIKACLAPLFNIKDKRLASHLSSNVLLLKKTFQNLAGEKISNASIHPSLPPLPPKATSSMLQMIEVMSAQPFVENKKRNKNIQHIILPEHIMHCGFAKSVRLASGMPLIII